MNRRVRALWLPALAVTLVAEATLFLVTRSGYRPWTVFLDWHVFHSHHPLQLYVPWLAALPFIAAAAALWSRRRGGSSRESAVVALFPALAAFGLTVVATVMDVFVDVFIQQSHALEHSVCGAAWALVSFVAAPALALAPGLLGSMVWWRHAPLANPKAGPLEARGA